MKVLLLENVKGLGVIGDICEVKDGYGQNFLIAKGKAKHATNEVIRKHQAQMRKEAEIHALELAEKKQFIQTLSGITVSISKKVGANDALFGAITKEEIAESLHSQHNLELNKKDIEIKHPIKNLGSHEVEVKLGDGISGVLKLEVVAQG
ncbi:50S ribosomal protein L9 [Helicobacter mustelae]|uniref:Large ribosomal subunit protein bL9 n=1 Tax=Helicobacter mustelae (strain ATCC 43772 / CCUG 25715 / CIP 103759 / LMG 18044 / NCTC 12198 / R85-136P) TaxID=679897 RepID=D3UHJ1_HELM1|nr:50S ribosomal protein L9 [Helicobacter mustelae]CBG39963.1 50S ribosomal protein L9 [Helicobacter mustelae 12198]SQH71476.1 50S ribosomal protein L9 [Helicobacter mustelae]STP12603.1 50S ribosomal protein L9 [Helicobacter mustelae]